MARLDVLLARSRDLPKPDRDAAPLEAALQAAGLRARWASWDDGAENWRAAPRVLIRSTWGYALEVDRYLAWIGHVAGLSALDNPAHVVRWNAHKRYLLDLEARGVPVVPTALLPRGEAVDPQAVCRARGWKRVVIKPAVSAGSHETHAFAADAIDAITFNRVLTAGDVLMQPYVDSVDGHGERSMIFIDGMLTHAIRKAPRWVGQDENITGPMPISAAERTVAEAAMAAIGEPLLYGRVDLVLDANGAPRVAELELIEPSLFFDFEPLAAKRLVAGLLRAFEIEGSAMRPLKLVLMSDTHMRHDSHPIPAGDIFLHAGDLTHRGRPKNLAICDDWFGTLPHRHRVLVAGNHDFLFQLHPEAARALIRNATYLEDSETTIEDLRVWGTPWQPWFLDWAFNLKTEEELAEKWALMPDGIDILVSHSPPYGIGDLCGNGDRAGCRALLRRVLEVKPKLHVFGHIHENRGWWRLNDTLFINASNGYEGEYPAIVVEWDADGPRVVSDTPRMNFAIRPPRT